MGRAGIVTEKLQTNDKVYILFREALGQTGKSKFSILSRNGNIFSAYQEMNVGLHQQSNVCWQKDEYVYDRLFLCSAVHISDIY